jgi:hypothetical protein
MRVAIVRVEAEPQIKHSRCERCNGTTWMILGYVYADEEPHGIYYVDWCEGPHDHRAAFVTVSLGNYGDQAATGADRLAFCIETRCNGMALVDQPVHDRPDFLGRFVPRDEALQGPDLDHLWHVCDHLTDDRRFAAVAAWLCGELDTALDADDDAPARAE